MAVNHSLWTSLILILFLNIKQSSLFSDSITYTPIPSNPRIFYENLGKAHITSNTWSLVTYRNLTNYQLHFFQLRERFHKLETICSKYQKLYHHDYTDLLYILHYHLFDEQKNMRTLENLVGMQNSHRSKSSLFSSGSELLKQVFGTPSEDDAKFYENSINKCFNNQRKITEFMRQNIQISYHSVELINNTIQTTQSQEKTFQNQLHYL